MQRAPTSWVIDPDDPRAPPQELWDRMAPEERQRVLDTLPSKFDISEARIEETEMSLDEERQRADEERQRADEAERRLAEALAELERLKRERG
ncbi:hypothetical protein [Sorangium atrum]|uniref:Uncharacterized protein n=1 Tax=Sorangium atrum TaxID=2995308 RepID=A0ABT5CF06_9BACT|nr:hypothetical protein [Sorangium aterium]MDC0685033.1 hypothetical protein [Sorangium aterium]